MSDKSKRFSLCQHKQQTITTIISYFESEGTLNLDREYQRDVVWDQEHMQNFIESVAFYGISPSNIIFSEDENGTYHCIDGKQRLTTIHKYTNNEFPFLDTNEQKYVYYSKCPTDVELFNKDKTREMTSIERRKFGNHSIPICIYENLKYEDEVEIFLRIQYGVSPTKPETIMSHLKHQTQAKTLKALGNKHKKALRRFSCATRKSEINFIMLLLYTTNNDDSIITPKRALKYLSDLSCNFLQIHVL